MSGLAPPEDPVRGSDGRRAGTAGKAGKAGKARKEGELALDPIERAIEDLRSGRIVIVVDDEDRENEGDL
ncbi:MAG: 3,4-dihydroxy-2-butanone-4-phosphate synthase, partial [Gemmatimonadetes bacterium]|nr:3,4-dihydroxy-2-butanone-4-phosphate synthase [Gemmatimonadota bacterium]